MKRLCNKKVNMSEIRRQLQTLGIHKKDTERRQT